MSASFTERMAIVKKIVDFRDRLRIAKSGTEFDFIYGKINEYILETEKKYQVKISKKIILSSDKDYQILIGSTNLEKIIFE